MARGGRRSGAGRPALSAEEHVLRGTFRKHRHGERPPHVVAMPVSPPADWRPTPEDRASLQPRSLLFLDAVLTLYQLNPLEGLSLLECLRTLSRIELLEPGGSSVELTREHRTFASQWASLRLEE